MENKLELKHISPYLPYGLKIIFEKSGKIIELSGIELSESEKLIFINKNAFFESTIWNFKPILRHLSDLTKEIEHNGEKFVPYNELYKIKKGIEVYEPININYPIELLIETENYSQDIDLFDGYLIIQKLIEWHFDVFGLIKKRLAVDINTIE